MDELERRLRADAAELSVEVSEPLGKRIDAALAAAVRVEQPPRVRQRRFWWMSALSGAAAAMVAILLLNLRAERLPAPPNPDAQTRIVPVVVEQTQSPFALDTRSAVLTEPLEEELEHLKADFERARDEVTGDLRGSF